jgi:hypothetical protein
MIDYSKGKIYKLICDKSKLVYIGSTTLSLDERLRIHKSLLDCNCKILFDLGKVDISLIEDYPCLSKKELELKEGDFIKYYKYFHNDLILNKYIAGGSMKKINTKNKNKKYVEKHRMDLREKARGKYHEKKEFLLLCQMDIWT